jgi:exodeoxyribonuclease VII small subunit
MNDQIPDTFEDSLKRLQELVQRLESGEQGLEASLQIFEEGTRLLRDCYGRLEQAERKIEILTGFDSAGNPLTAPFDASSTLEQSTRSPGEQPSTSGSDSTKKPTRRKTSRKTEPDSEPEETGQGELPF